MSETMVILLPSIAFAGILLWLLRSRARFARAESSPTDEKMAAILPKHYRYFPVIRQALSAGDDKYLREVASPRVARQVLRERRVVAKRFLRGLHEDFSSLERLGRMVASLSPVVSRQQETERLFLGVRFRLLYALVWLGLFTGRVPLLQLGHLTELIGRLALRMEQAMAEISELTADRVPRGLSA